MNYLLKIELNLFCGLWLFTMFPTATLASDGPPLWIFEMNQDGQNVNIVLQMSDIAEPGFEEAFRITRTGNGETVSVLADHFFNEHDAIFTGEPGCQWFDMDMAPAEFCRNKTCDGCEDAEFFRSMCSDCDGDGTPDCWGDCVENSETGEMVCRENYCDTHNDCNTDCDGDGINDCAGGCETVYRFEIVDECVPAGHYEYAYYSKRFEYLEWDALTWIDGPTVIDVFDSGQECTPLRESENEHTARDDDGVDAGSEDSVMSCSSLPLGTMPESSIFSLFFNF